MTYTEAKGHIELQDIEVVIHERQKYGERCVNGYRMSRVFHARFTTAALHLVT